MERYFEHFLGLSSAKYLLCVHFVEKAPGTDGFNFNFLKANWDIIKGDILAAVHHFEASAIFGSGCNSSFISLIPKVKLCSWLISS